MCYEAPHRVRATLAALRRQRSATSGTLVIARELTKRFEAIARVSLGEAQAWIADDANRERGEFVLVVDAAPAAAPRSGVLDAEVERWLAALLREVPVAAAARVVAAVTGVPREQLYERAVALKKGVAE